MSNSPPITLRDLRVADMLPLWKWNNAPAARAVSICTTSIPFAEHRAWFMRRLADSDSSLFVVESEGAALGVVRFQRNSTLATVSISLAATCRGRGIGRTALTTACAAHHREFSQIPIEAWILEGNEPSRRCFTAAGFVEHDRRHQAGRWFVVLRYQPATKETQ